MGDMEHTFDTAELLAQLLARVHDPGGLPPDDLEGLLTGLELVSRRVEAAMLCVVSAADRMRRFQADGHRNVTSWQQAVVNCARTTAVARTRSARLAQRAPQVAERLAAGAIGVEQVRALARLSANRRCAERLFDEGEAWIPQLLDYAASMPLADFRLVLDRWEQLADDDGSGLDQARRRRHVHLSIVGDVAVLKGQFDAATGLVLKQILAVFENAEFTTQAQSGDISRTAGQRRADAMVALFHQAIGGPQNVSVVVNLVVDADNLDHMLRHEPLNPGPGARCDTVDGIAVSPTAIMSAALAGRVRAVVMDGRGVVIALGRRQRLFTGAVRDAARLQGLACVWPGCGSPFSQIDHVVGWSHGGETDPHNAVALCGHHNRWKFDHRYSIERVERGRYRVRRPDGSAFAVPV